MRRDEEEDGVLPAGPLTPVDDPQTLPAADARHDAGADAAGCASHHHCGRMAQRQALIDFIREGSCNLRKAGKERFTCEGSSFLLLTLTGQHLRAVFARQKVLDVWRQLQVPGEHRALPCLPYYYTGATPLPAVLNAIAVAVVWFPAPWVFWGDSGHAEAVTDPLFPSLAC